MSPIEPDHQSLFLYYGSTKAQCRQTDWPSNLKDNKSSRVVSMLGNRSFLH